MCAGILLLACIRAATTKAGLFVSLAPRCIINSPISHLPAVQLSLSTSEKKKSSSIRSAQREKNIKLRVLSPKL